MLKLASRLMLPELVLPDHGLLLRQSLASKYWAPVVRDR